MRSHLLLFALLLGGCLANEGVDDDDSSAQDDDDTGTDDDDTTGDDDDATGDDDDATGDYDDATGDDDDATGDDDDTVDPAMQLGTLASTSLVDFDGVSAEATLTLTSATLGNATFVSGTLLDSAGATVGMLSSDGAGVVTLTWDPAGHDWRAANPAIFDLALSLNGADGPIEAEGQWAVSGLPSEAAVSWDGNGGWLLLPSPLALRATDGVRFGSNPLSPAGEPQPGLWSLGASNKPNYSSLNLLCTTAGTPSEDACFGGFATDFSGSVSTIRTATTNDGQTAEITLVEPFDWDEDGAVDGDDLLSWASGTAPCREISFGSLPVPYPVGPSEHTLAGPLSVDQDLSAAVGAPIDTASADVYAYGRSGGTYSQGPMLSGVTATMQPGGVLTLDLPPDTFSFRVTNPGTVSVELLAEDAGGRCYTGSRLLTVGATPSVAAMAWIDGELYVGSGGLVAPRSGSSAFFSSGGNFGPQNEVMTGIWRFDSPSAAPVWTDLSLLYFSAGQRYATSYNESYLYSFTTASTTPLILEGTLFGSETGLVHVPVLTDLDGDGAVDPGDLRAYLDTL